MVLTYQTIYWILNISNWVVVYFAIHPSKPENSSNSKEPAPFPCQIYGSSAVLLDSFVDSLHAPSPMSLPKNKGSNSYPHQALHWVHVLYSLPSGKRWHIELENHHVSWVKTHYFMLFPWPCSIAVSLPEAAMLSSVPKSPSHQHPSSTCFFSPLCHWVSLGGGPDRCTTLRTVRQRGKPSYESKSAVKPFAALQVESQHSDTQILHV